MSDLKGFLIAVLLVLGVVGLFFIPMMIAYGCAVPNTTILECGWTDYQLIPYWWIIILASIVIGEIIFIYAASEEDIVEDEYFILVKMVCIIVGNGIVFGLWGTIWIINNITRPVINTVVGIIFGVMAVIGYFVINYFIALWFANRQTIVLEAPKKKRKRRKSRRRIKK